MFQGLQKALEGDHNTAYSRELCGCNSTFLNHVVFVFFVHSANEIILIYCYFSIKIWRQKEKNCQAFKLLVVFIIIIIIDIIFFLKKNTVLIQNNTAGCKFKCSGVRKHEDGKTCQYCPLVGR